MSNLETEIEKQENQSENALLNLKYVIGMPNDSTIVLSENFDEMMENFAFDVSADANVEDRIESKLLNKQAELKSYDIKQARSAYFPSFYAFAFYGTLAQRPDFSFFDTNLRWFDFGSVGFNVRIPIFDGFKAKSQVQQRKLELEKIENNKENLKQIVDLQVTSAQNNLANAMFNEGVGSSFELSQAQQEYTSTMINYTQSLYNLLVAKLEVTKALGTL
jgi:outer membrane protein TolC